MDTNSNQPEAESQTQSGHVQTTVFRQDGSVENYESHNARVNAGFSLEMSLLFNGGSGASFQWLALSSSAPSPAIGDTSLATEITSNGLGRFGPITPTITAPTAPNGQGSIVFSHLFTATGAQVVAGMALLNASSAGTMYAEAALGASVSLQNGDSVQITYSIAK